MVPGYKKGEKMPGILTLETQRYAIKLDNFENDLSDILINKKNHFDDMKKYNREKSEMFSLKAILSKMKSIYGLE